MTTINYAYFSNTKEHLLTRRWAISESQQILKYWYHANYVLCHKMHHNQVTLIPAMQGWFNT